MTPVTRRHIMALGLAGISAPRAALAASPADIGWDDLIPPGVPYSQIIGEGELDEENDIWLPVFDSNATRLNEALNGAYIRMPGYIIPMELSEAGVTEFILVPYVGACIHVPPPPANQLVYVRTATPWPTESLWDAVWVVGHLRTRLMSTKIARIGYELKADRMEAFEW